jgi:RNA polymerase sigma-70 factor (ECF subfamily)
MMALYPMQEERTMASLIRRVSQGDKSAADELFSVVYDELRILAGWFIRRERPGHTLQPTALVNEVYLRMLGDMDHDWISRAHFFATAGAVMRRILVDYARSRGALKRGRAAMMLQLNENFAVSNDHLDLILAIDGALVRLEAFDSRQANIVVLRFFAGLTEEEIALILNTSGRTVKREWKIAKAWLRAEFNSDAAQQAT